MWDLEYLLLFGIPDNKIELLRGRSRWAFPFTNRELAEAHFQHWLESFSRWKQVPASVVRKGKRRWKAKVGGISVELFPRPIDVRIPIQWEAFDALYQTFWWPEMWPNAEHCRDAGFKAALDHQDVGMNLWSLFGTLCRRYGGKHSGRVDLGLSDTSAVAPDQYYFRGDREPCTVEGGYFRGVPDLIAEVLSPSSRAIDCGPRKELYRRSGVPHFWLFDPEAETVETYELADTQYQHMATYRAGDELQANLFPGETIRVDDLFRTQTKRNGLRPSTAEPEPIPEWIIAPDTRLGLEYFFLLGHPEHRWEIWGNRAPSVLAFGSPAEAQARLACFLEEACQWEGVPGATPAPLGPDTDQAEVGRFKFTRSGRHVHLDVAVDARKYREMLTLWTKREAWDWGGA